MDSKENKSLIFNGEYRSTYRTIKAESGSTIEEKKT